MSGLPRQKSNFPKNKKGSILYSFLLHPLHKIFSHLQNKSVIMFFVYKNRFLARQIGNGRSGTVMAFIPDIISAHVNLLEDNDPIKKKQRWLLSAVVFRPQKQQECFSEDHDRFISVDSVGRENSIYTTANFFKLW